MTEQSTESNQKHTQDVSVGETLRAAREKCSYSIAYVAAHTHLNEEVIRALENDDHEALPSAVFTKGYIRSVAKLLDIDAEALLGEYSQPGPVEYVIPEVKRPKKVRSSGADPVVIWSSVTVVALLVGLLTTWWLHRDEANPVELASVVEQFDEIDSAQQDQAASESNNDNQTTSPQVGLGSIDPKNISQVQDENSAVDAPLTQQQANSVQPQNITESTSVIESPVSGGDIDKVRITVRYTQESWTEIFDARKRRLLHGLIKPGATRVISGQAPFNVFLGNSPGVELEINGKPFDHSVYMRRNNTARFLIDDINS